MIVTDRDMKILNYIDRFQFSKRRIIKELYFTENTDHGANKASHKRIVNLYQKGFLKRIVDHRTGEFIYYLSDKGASCLSMTTEAPTVAGHIAWAKYFHNELAQKVLIEFSKVGQRRFMSERDFRRFMKRSDLIPDLILVKDNDQFIYVEIELEEKNYSELTDRAERFALEKNLAAVLYVCGNKRIEKKVQEAFNRADQKINLYSIEESHFFKNAHTFCQEILA